MPAPPRITVKDVAGVQLHEPVLTGEDTSDYLRGWELFSCTKYWHAHEAWEAVWKRHPEPSRLFFEGIIQLAAAYHLLTVKRLYRGTMGNFAKAEEKLRLLEGMFPGVDVAAFLGVDVRLLLQDISAARTEIERVGAHRLEEFSPALLPHVACILPFATSRTALSSSPPDLPAERS